MKKIPAAVAALLPAIVLMSSCTPVEDIDRLCSAHPVRMPDAPVHTDGYFLSRYWLTQREVDWAAEALLKRGFRFVETDVAGGGVRRYSLSTDAAQCAAVHAAQGRLPAHERASVELKQAELGLKPGECVASQRQPSPTARYRVQLINHSPPRNNWVDGLTGRQDVRVQASLVDAETQSSLADIRSFTLMYQVTVSGNPVQGCNRRAEVKRLLADYLQPHSKPVARGSAVRTEDPVATFPVQREEPLVLLESTGPGGLIGWQQKNAMSAQRPAALPNVALVGTPKDWNLRMPSADGLRVIPLAWIGPEHRTQAYMDQPARILRTPRGVGLMLVWRKASKADAGIMRFTWVEFSHEGKPLLRLDAPVPLEPGINPFDVLLSVPALDAEGRALTVTATELEPAGGATANASGQQVRKSSTYRWPLQP